MMTIQQDQTPIRFDKYKNCWQLWDSEQLIAVAHTRIELVELAHERELLKINRIKRLEQLYSQYQGASLWTVL